VEQLLSAFPKEFVFRSLGNPGGNRIIHFACSERENATQLAQFGASVTEVDM
jgi:hypothetical protein